MTWDALWWLILGSLLGWVALWFCDKLFLRDGEVAGIRAERELAAANSELDLSRDQIRRGAEKIATLESDLVASNDQADVLRTELAVMRNERDSLKTEAQSEKERNGTIAREIESSRKLAAERVDEINRLKQNIVALENERDVAQRWAQGKEHETARLNEQRRQDDNHLVQARRLLGQANHNILAAQRTARMLETRLGSHSRARPKLHAKLRARMKQLASIKQSVEALRDVDEARRKAGKARASQAPDQQQPAGQSARGDES